MEYDTITSISAEEFAGHYKDNKELIFDVRRANEYKSEHLEGAHNTQLDYLNDHLSEFPDNKTFFVHCAGGYRSVIAASILKSRGIHNLIDIAGGYQALKETNVPKTNFVCPSTTK